MSRVREEIRSLMESLVAMADEVGLMLAGAQRAFANPSPNGSADLVEMDRAINRMENLHDSKCLRILALYQPEADDLRTVFMALKINNDIERIADHALNVAERSEALPAPPYPFFLGTIDRMGSLSRGMLSDAITAFVARDSALAKSVISRDDEADEMLREVFREILSHDYPKPIEMETALAVVLAAKELERIADLCTNIAEDVVFMAEGAIVKHSGEI